MVRYSRRGGVLVGRVKSWSEKVLGEASSQQTIEYNGRMISSGENILLICVVVGGGIAGASPGDVIGPVAAMP